MDQYELVRKKMMNLWSKTVDQLEHVSDALLNTSGLEKIKYDLVNVSEERERLVIKLGQAVYELLDQGSLKVPGHVQGIFNQARSAAEEIEQRAAASKEKVAKIKVSTIKAQAAVETVATKAEKAVIAAEEAVSAVEEAVEEVVEAIGDPTQTAQSQDNPEPEEEEQAS